MDKWKLMFWCIVLAKNKMQHKYDNIPNGTVVQFKNHFSRSSQVAFFSSSVSVGLIAFIVKHFCGRMSCLFRVFSFNCFVATDSQFAVFRASQWENYISFSLGNLGIHWKSGWLFCYFFYFSFRLGIVSSNLTTFCTHTEHSIGHEIKTWWECRLLASAVERER